MHMISIIKECVVAVVFYLYVPLHCRKLMTEQVLMVIQNMFKVCENIV